MSSGSDSTGGLGMVGIIEKLTGRQLCEWWFRVEEGRYCRHELYGGDASGADAVSTFTPWTMANMGANQYRWCRVCMRWEWV